MRRLLSLILAGLFFIPAAVRCEQPQKQISFARESKSHEYYVKQAELWWKEVELNRKSEENWYNYFRACRNAHGTSDWRSDFINESSYLRTGDSILALIREEIPNTFTFYYLSYLNQGIGPENADNILTAYNMNPDFEGIHSSVISYAESSLNPALRKTVNERWFKTNYLSSQLLTYANNVLAPLDSNSVLFTQNDNDTYPLWMIQDALGIRTDVTVINIDFLLLENYRKQVYQTLQIPELKLGTIDVDEYHSNWRTVLTHVLVNYKGMNSVYLGMTVAEELYKDFEKKLFPCGLAYKFSKVPVKHDMINRKFYEETAMLDYLRRNFSTDQNQVNVDYQNLNYLTCFEIVYKQYRSEKKQADAKKLKDLSLLLVNRIGKQEYIDWVEREFK